MNASSTPIAKPSLPPAFLGEYSISVDESTGGLICNTYVKFTFTVIDSGAIKLVLDYPEAVGKLVKWAVS
jgi:hypothetical protein